MFRPQSVAAPDRARRPRPRGLRALVALATSVVATATVLATAPAASAALTGAGTIEPTTKFPTWYKDANGLALQLCLDGLPNCLASFDELVTTHNAGGDGEAFYYAADAELGPITVHNALEAAYAADGLDQEVTFMRSQVSAPKGGLTPNATYTITDPYGVLTCKASATGTIPNNGCRTETTPVPLDFNAALRGRISTFLTWDTGAPAGFIGDNTTPHKVVGSPTDFNKVRVQGAGFTGTCTNADGTTVTGCQETDLFVVQGKVQPGPSASTSVNALDFGNVTAPVTKTVKYTSTGSEPVTVTGVTTDGAAFTTTEDCTTAAGGIAPGASCTIGVTYTPVAGTSTGSVTIADSTGTPPRTVRLSGSSVGVATQDVKSLAFGTQKVGTTSASEVVTVGNSGVAPVAVSAPAISGSGAAHFKVVSNGCTTPVAPDAGCEIAVAFVPTSNGAKTATLTLPTNGGNLSVPLSGTGTTPVVTMSATSLAFADQAAGTTSAAKAVTLTNGGTAALSIDDVTVPAQFKQIGGSCTVGLNVAPGSSCNVTVAFAPTTAGAKTGTLAISADGAINNVALSGTGTAPPDGVAPTAPTALKATAAGGTQVDLTWTAASDNVGVTRYDVTRDGVVVGSTATTSYSDTGLAQATSHTYSVKALDAAGNASAASASVTAKTLDVTAPSIPATVTATATGTSTINVTWAASTDNVGVTGYRVYRDGGATAVGSPTTTSFTDTGLAAGSAHSYTVAAIDAQGNLTAKSAPASATTNTAPADPAPSVTARTPAANATGVSTTGNITATFSEAVTGVSGTTFTLKNAATGAAVGATSVAYNATTRVATFDPNVTLANGTTYTATLTGGTTAIRDSANQPLPTTTWSFTTAAGTTDPTAPAVTNRAPAVNSTAFPVANNVTATFSEPVTGVSGTSFTLKNAAGTAIAASVSYNATTRVATLNPTANLPADTKYTASLTTAIKDAAGNALPATSWTFTAGPAPTVSARTPGAGGTGFAAANNITATFSEPVTGINGTTFTLKNAAGTAVAASVSYNATTRVATLNPTANLVNDTKYTASLTTAIKDAGGNPLAATTWTFTTGPVPTVTARTPAVNATGVSRTANVSATFSEAVTGWTTTTATVKNTATGAVQSATVTYNAATRVLTINPSATLAASTKFTVTLTNGVKDTIGNPIAATSWSFTTGA